MPARANRTVDILLATYNGAKYLEEQLASIEAQTFPDWHLIARDDGSADQTPAILSAFQTRHPRKVTLLQDHDGNLGLVQNFSRLMEASTAPYAAFCDQDDVWLPEKLSVCVEKMRQLETEHGAGKPLLVFTDLIVVDEALNVIAPSFWRYQDIRPIRCRSLHRLLLQNVVTGSTTLLNRPLIQLVVPLPDRICLHDWWVALSAAVFGKAAYMSSPLILYRQHGANVEGALPLQLSRIPALAWRFIEDYREHRVRFSRRFVQAEEFLNRFAERLTTEERVLLTTCARMPKWSLFMRALIITRYRMAPTGLWRRCLFVLLSAGRVQSQ